MITPLARRRELAADIATRLPPKRRLTVQQRYERWARRNPVLWCPSCQCYGQWAGNNQSVWCLTCFITLYSPVIEGGAA